MKFLLNLITFVLLSLALNQTGVAQLEKLLGGEKTSAKPSAELVSQNACMAAAVFPEQITSNELLKLFPHEIVTAWGEKELGFDPMLIKQATWVVNKPENLDEPPAWAAVLHFEEMQGLAGGMIDELEEKRIGGKAVFSAKWPQDPSFMVVDEATMVIGIESLFEDMLVQPRGKVAKLFDDSVVDGQAYGFIDVEMLRPTIDEAIEKAGDYELAPPVERLKEVHGLLQSVLAGLETKSKLEATIVLRANSKSDGEKLNEIIVEAMEYGKVNLLSQMSQQLDLNDPVQVATIQYAKRMSEKYEKILAPTVDGNELTIKVPHQAITTMPYLSSMIFAMARVSIDSPKLRLTDPQQQLRFATLSALNYESAHQHFPRRVIKDENGKALFSGQVAMLPFLEQANIYDSLRLEESWDSEHNSQFTSMAIEAFGISDEGLSTIRFPVFPGSAWDDEDRELTFGDIRDGSSNTIFAIQAPPESAASWADPTPWNISKDNPMKDVFGDRDEVTVSMFDGSTQVLKKENMTNEKLKAMLTFDGGEVIEN